MRFFDEYPEVEEKFLDDEISDEAKMKLCEEYGLKNVLIEYKNGYHQNQIKRYSPKEFDDFCGYEAFLFVIGGHVDGFSPKVEYPGHIEQYKLFKENIMALDSMQPEEINQLSVFMYMMLNYFTDWDNYDERILDAYKKALEENYPDYQIAGTIKWLQ